MPGATPTLLGTAQDSTMLGVIPTLLGTLPEVPTKAAEVWWAPVTFPFVSADLLWP